MSAFPIQHQKNYLPLPWKTQTNQVSANYCCGKIICSDWILNLKIK